LGEAVGEGHVELKRGRECCRARIGMNSGAPSDWLAYVPNI
jgi:hypothetical protein